MVDVDASLSDIIFAVHVQSPQLPIYILYLGTYVL